MLPISIVDNPGFREYINYIDPSFTIPSRKTIKDTSLPKMKEAVETKITNILKTIKHPNVCTDLWSDATARPFNGFVFQGIDDDWNLKTITSAFDYIEGIIHRKCIVKVYKNRFCTFKVDIRVLILKKIMIE